MAQVALRDQLTNLTMAAGAAIQCPATSAAHRVLEFHDAMDRWRTAGS